MQFTLPLARGVEPLHKQIDAGLRGAVLCGKLAPGSRLPSTRDLSEQLGVSRPVVLEAYDQPQRNFIEMSLHVAVHTSKDALHDWLRPRMESELSSNPTKFDGEMAKAIPRLHRSRLELMRGKQYGFSKEGGQSCGTKQSAC